MQVKFRESFTKDLAAIKDAVILRKIKDSVEHLEEVKTPNQIFGIKKLKGYNVKNWTFPTGNPLTWASLTPRREPAATI